jgi:demethylmenaquinone methyltransferase/2-methoxy-6-polyprenyl-1,4-benzoquinol methylase
MLGYVPSFLPEFPQRYPKALFNESFLRDRHFGLQEYFKKIPQKLFETPELTVFLETLNVLGERGYNTKSLERNIKLSSTLHVSRTKQSTKSSYDNMSSLAFYDSIKELKEHLIREKSFALLKVKEGERVLEIGYGTGHAIVDFAMAVGQNGLVCGLDISEGMMNKTQKRLIKEGINNWDNIKLGLGDASQRLPYENASFDIAYMSFTLELLGTPEMVQLLNECNRVLDENGRICIACLAKNSDGNIAVKLYEWLYQNVPFFMNCRPIFVKELLEGTSYVVEASEQLTAWAIPIDIVVAKKYTH